MSVYLMEFCYYPSIFLRSASGVDIGEIPNFSTKTFRILGETNAGSVGPR